MRRSKAELLSQLAQLDPEYLAGTQDGGSGSNDITRGVNETLLARVLATPRVEQDAERTPNPTSPRRSFEMRERVPPRYRRAGFAAALLAVGGLVLGLVVSTGSGPPVPSPTHRPPLGSGVHSVLTALTSTTAAENYAFNYSTTFQPGSGSLSPGPINTSGYGIVNFDPYAMLTTNSSTSSYAGVTGVFDSNDAWEFGLGGGGVGGAVPPIPLSEFAQGVEESLGQGQGALEMIGLSYPTGRLNLDQNTIASVQPIGAGTVDGVAVTNYEVSVDLSRVLAQPGLTAMQQTTITQALALLSSQGYEGTTEVVSIDAAGFIREVKSAASFSDGGSVKTDSILSNIGCAGTVTPGQPVPTPAPAGCVSPDQPGQSTTPQSSTTPSSSSTTSTFTTPSSSTPSSTTQTSVPGAIAGDDYTLVASGSVANAPWQLFGKANPQICYFLTYGGSTVGGACGLSDYSGLDQAGSEANRAGLLAGLETATNGQRFFVAVTSGALTTLAVQLEPGSTISGSPIPRRVGDAAFFFVPLGPGGAYCDQSCQSAVTVTASDVHGPVEIGGKDSLTVSDIGTVATYLGQP
jgi:hypothetical protein